jgi:hypothetical protein
MLRSIDCSESFRQRRFHKEHVMKTRVILILCVAAMVCPAAGQTKKPAVVQYVGVVTGTNVYVRSGPNTDAYACTKVSTPATVQVVEESADFLKILPTPGTYSIISKQYVTVDATGKVGTITGSSVRARAGGDLHPGKSFSDFWFIHRIMNKGDQVQIIGSGGDFYKVTPPARAYFWISKKFVKRGVAAKRPGKTPGTDGTETPATQPDGKTPVGPPQTAEDVDEINRAFRAAEKMLRAEYKKPAGRRDLQSVVDAFRAIKAPEGGYMREQVDGIVAFMQEVILREADIEQAKELLDEAAAKQKEYEMARAKVQLDAPAKAAEPRYTARGVLTASAVFAGGPSGPKRYLLRNVAAKRVVGYVQCTTDAVDLAAFEGKEVGVIGTSSYNSRLGTTIIEATKVELLGDVDLPAPPKPIVKPYTPPPKPAPVEPLPRPEPKVDPEKPVKLESLPEPKPSPKRPKRPRPPVKIGPAAPTAKVPAPVVHPKPLPRPKPIVIEPIPDPIVVEPKPVIIEPKPVVIEPTPVIVEPKPVVVEPKPALVKPKPVVIEIKPPITEPKPVVVEPKPALVKPKPVVIEIKPPITEPKPVVVEPKPALVKPKPIVVEPKPVVVEPKPAPALVKPKIAPRPYVRPAPIVLEPPSSDPAVIAPPVRPTVKPAPKAKPIIIEPKPILYDPKAGPKLKPPSVGKPKPKVQPKPKAKPAKPGKATTRPAPTTQPTTKPAIPPAPKPIRPLPPTGLPMADPDDAPDKPAVNEKDYE